MIEPAPAATAVEAAEDGGNTSVATVEHLQRLVELDKTALARHIHDDLGGCLIASAMDVTSLRHRFAGMDEDALFKFDRVARMLNGAIDMLRRVTEELHPTLLDNVGLFAALRWQVNEMCQRSKLSCTSDLPEAEPHLSAAAAISLFRVGQEALTVAESQPGVSQIAFSATLDAGRLAYQVTSDGLGVEPVPNSRGYVALSFIRHRINALGGDVVITHPPGDGMLLNAQVQLTGRLTQSV